MQSNIRFLILNKNWVNKSSRSSVEIKDPNSRLEIAKQHDNMDEYYMVFVGFPIWRYVASAIINTFLEGDGSSGKTIIPFVKSRGS